MPKYPGPKYPGNGACTLAFAALFAACAANSPPELPALDIDIPAEWTSATADKSARDQAERQDAWWESFGDERLNALVAEALRANRDLKATAERIARAEASAVAAGAELLPQLNTAFNGSRRKQIFVGFPIPGQTGPLSTRSTNYGVSLKLSWELDLWGRIRAGRRAASTEHAAARFDYLAAGLSVAAQTCKAFFALTEAHAQLTVAKARFASQKATTELISVRYQKGMSPALDLKLARQGLAASEVGLAVRERALDQAKRQCELILGRYPGAKITASASLPELPPLPAHGLPAELLERRPDLLAAKQRLLAQGFRVKEAEATLLPRISLTASAGTQSNQLSDLLDGDFGVWSLLGNLVQPIFEGGRLRANVAANEAALREALENYANRCLIAFGEVENSLSAERWLARQESSARKVLKEAEGATLLARERYTKGGSGILELLLSERSVFDAQMRLIEVERSKLETRVDLNLALGGGLVTGRSTQARASGERKP